MAEWQRKRISVNAYRPSDAMNAVRQECRKQGIKARGFDFEYDRNDQRDDDHVAIVVTKTSDGTTIPPKDRRTIFVIFEAQKPERS